ncbi:FAD-dependent oxidoreductase, partial [Streptacidiphilus sp. N1-3]
RPEIDRTALRDLLLSSLAPGTVVWNHKVTAARALEDGRHELAFANGTTTAVDLLIGADGTWSRIRPLLSGAVPQYCGISYLELRLSDAPTRHPDAAAVVGPGILFALSDNKALMGHGGQNIHLGASLRVPQDWITASGVDWSDTDAARNALLKEFGDWSAELTDLIRHCDQGIVPRLIFALPIGHRWEPSPGVTLLGDAAHVMSPYAGEGANLAMLDATELALALVEHGINTGQAQTNQAQTALAQYEAAMFPRARAAAEASAAGLDLCFADDSPRALLDFFTGMPTSP